LFLLYEEINQKKKNMKSGPQEAFTIHNQAEYVVRCLATYHTLSKRALEYAKTWMLHHSEVDNNDDQENKDNSLNGNDDDNDNNKKKDDPLNDNHDVDDNDNDANDNKKKKDERLHNNNNDDGYDNRKDDDLYDEKDPIIDDDDNKKDDDRYADEDSIIEDDDNKKDDDRYADEDSIIDDDDDKDPIMDCFKAVILNQAMDAEQFQKAFETYAKESYWDPILKHDIPLEEKAKVDILDQLSTEEKVFVPGPAERVGVECACKTCVSIQDAKQNWKSYVPNTPVEVYCKFLIDKQAMES
jgi:hypothetical protein